MHTIHIKNGSKDSRSAWNHETDFTDLLKDCIALPEEFSFFSGQATQTGGWMTGHTDAGWKSKVKIKDLQSLPDTLRSAKRQKHLYLNNNLH